MRFHGEIKFRKSAADNCRNVIHCELLFTFYLSELSAEVQVMIIFTTFPLLYLTVVIWYNLIISSFRRNVVNMCRQEKDNFNWNLSRKSMCWEEKDNAMSITMFFELHEITLNFLFTHCTESFKKYCEISCSVCEGIKKILHT